MSDTSGSTSEEFNDDIYIMSKMKMKEVAMKTYSLHTHHRYKVYDEVLNG